MKPTVYNVLAIPVAAGLFYRPFGVSLAPQISALLMSELVDRRGRQRRVAAAGTHLSVG